MRLAAIRCHVCGVSYVWALVFVPANDRVEWRPRPDCACDESYGEPFGTSYIRDAYVAGDVGDRT